METSCTVTFPPTVSILWLLRFNLQIQLKSLFIRFDPFLATQDNEKLILFINFEIKSFSQSSQNNLKQHLAIVNEEIRQTKKVKYNIENDLAGKEVAIDIDHQTSSLKVTGPSKKVYSSTRYANDKVKKFFTPGDWQQFSETNLGLASSQIKRCLEMQSIVDGAMAVTASALKSQRDFTDRAFRLLSSTFLT